MFAYLIGFLRRKTTITFRIYLFAAMMVAVLYLSAVFALSAHLEAIRDARLKAMTFITNEILMKACAHALWRGNSSELIDISAGLLKSTSIESIVVRAQQGVQFFEARNEGITGELISNRVDVVRSVLAPEYEDLESDSSAPRNRQVKVGELYIEINKRELYAQVWGGIWSRFALLISMGLLVLPLAYILALSLVRPLKSIKNDVEKFEQGDFDNLRVFRKEAGTYTDEYSLISKALRDAGKSISSKAREIEKSNVALQARSEQLEAQYGIAIKAREQADEANAKKDVFVSNITHELKTPLTGVIAAIDLIEQSVNKLVSDVSFSKSTVSSYMQRREMHQDAMQLINCIEIAKFSGEQLETLVNEILISIQDMYSDVPLDILPVELIASLDKLLTNQKAIALKKGLSFEVSRNHLTALWIYTDWLRVAQVMNALVNNAIRFTEKGSIVVFVKVLESVDTVSLYFEVNDTGIGISKAEKERIFTHFHIAENPSKKALAGIGTGLSIAQRICERIGGTLALKSTVLGSGSSFSFSCYFDRCSAENIVTLDHDIRGLQLDIQRLNMRLLYVEDSLTNQQILREYCNRSGVDLVVADNGKGGLEKFQHGSYDGLIVDCYMPLMNGYELVENIRCLEASNNLQPSFIVALTADNSDKNKKRCKECGFNEFESKPYTWATFNRILEMVSLYKADRVSKRI